MTAITTRTSKGSALTFAEIDANFNNLKTDVEANQASIAGRLQIANNLSDLADVATARSSLGLGDSATKDVGTTAGTVSAGDHSHGTVYVSTADLANTSDPTKGDALVGFKSALTNAIARTVHNKLSDFVSVKDFGAVGDGVTDDTTAIQNAINALQQLGYIAGAQYPESTYIGQTLFFPSGIYLISSALTFAKSGCALIGEDSHSTAIFTTSLTANIITVGDGATDSTYNVTLANIHLGVNAGVVKTSGAHLYISNVRNAVLHNVYFSDVYNGLILNGVYKLFGDKLIFQDRNGYGAAKGNRAISFTLNTGRSVQQANVTDCRIYNSMIGGTINYPFYANCTDWNLIHGLHVNVAQQTSVTIEPDGATGLSNIWKLNFSDCYFDSAIRSHVNIKGAGLIEGLHFTNCYFTSYAYTGTTLYNIEIQNTVTGQIDDFILDNCYLDDAGYQSILINGTNVKQFKITRSYVKKFVGTGSIDASIIYSSAAYNSIVDNTFESGANASAYTNSAIHTTSGISQIKDNDFTLCQHADKLKVDQNSIPFISSNVSADPVISISHNTAITLTLPKKQGIIVFHTSSAGCYGSCYYRRYDGGGALIDKIANGTTDYTAVTTGVLAGTTGVDGNITLSVSTTNNLLYIENRRGFTIDLSITFI